MIPRQDDRGATMLITGIFAAVIAFVGYFSMPIALGMAFFLLINAAIKEDEDGS